MDTNGILHNVGRVGLERDVQTIQALRLAAMTQAHTEITVQGSVCRFSGHVRATLAVYGILDLRPAIRTDAHNNAFRWKSQDKDVGAQRQTARQFEKNRTHILTPLSNLTNSRSDGSRVKGFHGREGQRDRMLHYGLFPATGQVVSKADDGAGAETDDHGVPDAFDASEIS